MNDSTLIEILEFLWMNPIIKVALVIIVVAMAAKTSYLVGTYVGKFLAHTYH